MNKSLLDTDILSEVGKAINQTVTLNATASRQAHGFLTLSAVSVMDGGPWRIALFQNTPAAFHGRPEFSEQLTAELHEALRQSSPEANS